MNHLFFAKNKIKIKLNNLIFELNKENQTASVVGHDLKKDKIIDIFIPYSIKYNSQEYIITTLSTRSFLLFENINNFTFANNSAVSKIEKEAFLCTSIKTLTIPSSLVELEDGWCNELLKLSDIKLSNLNQHFIYFKDQFLLEKSDPTSNEFDILVFANRDIKTVLIPSFIRVIRSYSFNKCMSIEKVEFEPHSNLQIIEKEAFSLSFINSISIPQSLTFIGCNAFTFCDKLIEFIIPVDSNLKIIEKDAFSHSKIETIFIPSSVIQIGEKAFYFCKNLRKVDFSNDSNLQIIENNCFSLTSIEEFSVPSSVVKICEHAFYKCKNLEYFNIPIDSNLQTIESCAFSFTLFHNIYFPESLIELEDDWCDEKCNMYNVKIDPNNKFFIMYNEKYILGKSDPNNEEFDILVFACHMIQEVIIPSFIKIIGAYSFNNCLLIKKIEFQSNLNLQRIGKNAFNYSTIKKLTIPSSVIELKDGWCNNTMNLNEIDIIPNNKIFAYFDEKFIIGKSDPNSDKFDILVFARRDIKIAIIPSFIKIIGSYAFNLCIKLNKIEFSPDSKLKRINEYAFNKTLFERISIPSSLAIICENAFSLCKNLKKVDIKTDSKLRIIEERAFCFTSIENIFLPSKTIKIGSGAFYSCLCLRTAKIPNNNEFKIIEKDTFQGSSIDRIIIPKYLTHICDCSFYKCSKLRRVDFHPNSELLFIGDSAFQFTRIESFLLPKKVNYIGKSAFASCFKLQLFEINEDCDLKMISKDIFSFDDNVSIMIPASL